MVDALLGTGRRSFTDHLRSAAHVVVGRRGLDLERLPEALALAAALPARPGAATALDILRDAGLRLAALTNSGADAGRRTLQACGLADRFDAILGVDAVHTFKPHPAVYEYALRELRADPEPTALLATHPWDLAGAAHAGMATGWVTHGAHVWPEVFPSPRYTAGTLEELAHLLLADTDR